LLRSQNNVLGAVTISWFVAYRYLNLQKVNMKAVYVIIFGCLVLCLYACKKPGCDPGMMGPAAIIGKWNIVVDSTSTGAGSSNAFAIYTGEPGDYFDINANGYIYTKEGAKLDTSSYQLLSDSTVIIHSFVYFSGNATYPTCHIKSINANTITIFLPWIFSPGGAFGRGIILSR
jgi:hypothetical protein